MVREGAPSKPGSREPGCARARLRGYRPPRAPCGPAPSTPTLAGLGSRHASGAGVVSIVSGLTPEAAGRLHLIRGVLPPGVPSAARTLVIALGLGAIWLSRGLARRKHRAWMLAVLVVFASAVAHLVKGLDVEEATVHVVLLVALLRTRRYFVAPGDPATILPLAQVVLALLVVVPILVLHLSGDHAWSDRVDDSLLILVGALAFRGFWLWFRPLPVARPNPGDASGARRPLVERHGDDSLAYFALRRDKSYFFSPSRRSFLAYRVINGTALVAGDPIGNPAERRADPRVHAGRPREGLAGRDRRGIGRRARRLRAPGLQVDVPRRRGGDLAVGVLARRPRDPQGAPVGVAAREVRLRGTRPLDVRRRRAAARRDPRRLRGVARQLARSAASRWRWTRSSPTPTPCSRSRPAPTDASAASSSSCRRPHAAATRSPRCAAAATRRTG